MTILVAQVAQIRDLATTLASAVQRLETVDGTPARLQTIPGDRLIAAVMVALDVASGAQVLSSDDQIVIDEQPVRRGIVTFNRRA